MLPLNRLVPHLNNFEEVLVLQLVPIDLEDVLQAVQEVIECRLMMQDQQVDQMIDCSTLVRQILRQAVQLTDSGLHLEHVLAELVLDSLTVQDSVNDTIGGRLILQKPLLDLIRVVAKFEHVDVLSDVHADE